MPDAYVIETATAVAGIVVREDHGYRLFTADRRFVALERQLFVSPAAAKRAASRLVQDADAARSRFRALRPADG